MSDIVTTIKGAVCLPDTGCVSVVTCICDIMQDAADEIERLRGIIQQAADDVVAASYPRRMHLEWLEAARNALAEDD